MKLLKNNKTFFSLFLSSVFTMFGASLFSIVFLIYATSFQNKSLMVSIAEVFIVLPAFLSIYTGFWADKTKDKSKMMIFIGIMQMFFFLLIAIIIGLTHNFISFFIIGIIKFISDLLSSYKNGLRIPILQKNLKSNEVSSAFGQLQSFGSILEIVGQTFGVMFLSLTGQSFTIVAILNAFLYLISALILLFFKRYLTFNSAVSSISRLNIRETFSQIKSVFSKEKNNKFVITILSIIFINFILSGIGPVTDLALTNLHPFGNNYGVSVLIFNCFLSSGMIVGSLFMNDFLNETKMNTIILYVFGFSTLFGILLMHLTFLAPMVLFSIAYCASKTSPRVNSLILNNISPDNLGKVSGGISTLFTFSVPFGASLFIFIANLTSIVITFYIISLISLLGFLMMFLLNRQNSIK
ncbi:MFS transporter [Lactovum miscens]|uniref:MFS family permease n=1 Tax=Lactovum miscens TaxID=190387 RepID=A0A841C2E7_9LACT|nr:MFS transporter [Lactovum miscens]MBB5888126.1 MFS family permease [Lactovum miscens]